MTTRVDGINITDGVITEAKLQTKLNPDNAVNNNAFNIGVLGFKVAVQEGLTIYNLLDGIVDEFNSESGIDTAENSNTVYDATSDFYSNSNPNQPIPTPQIGRTSITDTGSGTYSVEPTTSAVDILIVGGGGSGGAGGYNNTAGGGGGAGGLIFYEDYPVTGGSSIPVSVGAGGRSAGGGGPLGVASSGYEPVQPQRFTWAYTPFPSATNQQLYTPGEKGTDSVFNAAPALVLTAEGGGAGGGYAHEVYVGSFPHAQFQGGSSGGAGSINNAPSVPNAEHAATQTTNHPVPGLSNDPLPGTPINARGAFGNAGGLGFHTGPQSQLANTGGGGGAGAQGGDVTQPQGQRGGAGGIGLNYNIADGSTPVGYAGGGGGGGSDTAPPNESVPYGAGIGQLSVNNESTPWLAPLDNPQFTAAYGSTESYPGGDGTANRGGGGGAGTTQNVTPNGVGIGGNGGSGVIIVAESRFNVSNTSMTLISDTFTASSTPSTARIVVFAELPDGLSDFTVSATRDNSTFNAITLTDEGFEAGSSGIKIFTGSTPLTGSASPQVQLRWKIVGSSLSGANKIHGVSLQWE